MSAHQIGSAAAAGDVVASLGGLARIVGPGLLAEDIRRIASGFDTWPAEGPRAVDQTQHLLAVLAPAVRKITERAGDRAALVRAALALASARLARLVSEAQREQAEALRAGKRHPAAAEGARVIALAKHAGWPVGRAPRVIP